MSATSRRLRLSLGIQSHAALHGTSGAGLVEFGRVSEDAGLDGVVIGDHVVLGNRLDRYPYPPVHFAQDASWMEPLTVLAAIAKHARLTFGSRPESASPALLPPVLLAKMAATIDQISDSGSTRGRRRLGNPKSSKPSGSTSCSGATAHRRHRRMPGTLGCRSRVVLLPDLELR